MIRSMGVNKELSEIHEWAANPALYTFFSLQVNQTALGLTTDYLMCLTVANGVVRLAATALTSPRTVVS